MRRALPSASRDLLPSSPEWQAPAEGAPMRFAIVVAAQFVALVVLYIVVTLAPMPARAAGWLNLALVVWGVWIAVQVGTRRGDR